MSPGGRRIAIGAWWLLLAILAAFAYGHLRVSSDLRSFMPPPQNADQRLLINEIGNGPASRLLLLAIDGAPPRRLAALSKGLVAALHRDAQFTQAFNGATNRQLLDSKLLLYRYLLSPTLDLHRLDSAYLHDQLLERVQDLASPVADMLEPLLPRDPTLEVLKLAQRWQPAHAPALRDGVWFSSRGEALLVAQTRAAGLDPTAQARAIESLRQTFAGLPDANRAKLTISGPGYFTVRTAATTRGQAEWLSGLGTLGFVVLLLVAYRSFGVLAVVALPLASGALAGLFALMLGFGSVHGITLAFGFTLLGVAQEYPIRVLSHRREGTPIGETVKTVWPLLRLAIVSACIAYLAFFASAVPGLQQLAVFTIVGLLVAGATTRWLLPAVLPLRFRDTASSPGLESLRAHLARLPRSPWIPATLLVLAVAMLWLAPTPTWQNNLSALTPVPEKLLKREGQLRAQLGAPDVRYLLVLQAPTAEAVLSLSEKIAPQIRRLVKAGAVEDVELPSRYLPSLATQRERQLRLPDRAQLQAALTRALQELPFRDGLFAPFVNDVEAARSLPLLTPAAFMKSPFGARLQSMLIHRDTHWLGLAAVIGVHDPSAFGQLSKQTDGAARLLDLKGASEALISGYRHRIAWALGFALLLLIATVAIAFGELRRTWRVIAPMSLATLLAFAVLRAGGVSLSLFHLVALTLAAGLGLHYALFFERRDADLSEARRTLHATVVCVISALLVFGLLATSTIPVLRAIGATVALGVMFHFCLSITMASRGDDD